MVFRNDLCVSDVMLEQKSTARPNVFFWDAWSVFFISAWVGQLYTIYNLLQGYSSLE